MKKQKVINFNGIDLAKIIMALFVVAIHLRPGVSHMNGWTLKLYESIIYLAVPFFFITTGFFLGRKMKNVNKYSLSDNNKIKEYLFKFLKLYLIFTIAYLPLSIYGYLNNGHGLLYNIFDFFKLEILVGKHFNSWILWYLLSCVYGLLLIYLLNKKCDIKKIIYVGLGLYCLSFIINFVLNIDGLNSIKKIINLTIQNGIIFESVIYLSLGMYISKIKQFKFKKWTYILFIGLLIILNTITPNVLNPLFILPCSIFVFIYFMRLELPDSKVWEYFRFLSNKIYFYHLYVWSIICFIIMNHKVTPLYGVLMYVPVVLVIIIVASIIYLIKKQKNNSIYNIKNIYAWFIGGVNIIIDIIMLYFICKLRVLPMKYIYIIILVLLVFNTIVFICSIFKKIIFKIIGCILTALLLIGTLYVIFYSNSTNKFFEKAFNNLEEHHENAYYVLVKNDYKDIKELNNQRIGFYKDLPNVEQAFGEFEFLFVGMQFDSVDELFDAINSGEIDAIVVEKSFYETIKKASGDNKVNTDSLKILYDYKIKVKDDYKFISNATDKFNIYVGGLDFTETNTDFNMIITVNRKTHKILLTSIPRDYYVDVYGKNGKDLLGYAGIWSLGTSVKTVENLFGISIDYYLRIHTNNLVDLVDALGGVEFCSNYGFTTTHALILGSYNDYHDEHLYVRSGCHNYNGIEILTIARERLQIGGDRQRQKNCQDIIINIFKKMASTNTFAHYEKILDKLGNTYTTNVTRSVVEAIIRDTIDNPNAWIFEKQSVDGDSGMNYVHFSNIYDHVMYPDMDTVATATNKIKEVLE